MERLPDPPTRLEVLTSAVSSTVTGLARWLREHVFTDENLQTASDLVRDVFRALTRVVLRARMPTRDEVRAFAGNQLIANAAAWSAALLSAGLVERFFDKRGLHNLWGLAASREKMLLSSESYDLLGTATGFVVGLGMLILVRMLVLGTLRELRDLRAPEE